MRREINNMELSKKVEYRISTVTMWLMVSLAISIDGLQFGIGTFSGLSTSAAIIPIVGIGIAVSIVVLGFIASGFISFFSFLSFWLWFKIKGIGFFDKGIGKLLTKLLIISVNAISDMIIPFWPGITISIIFIAIFSRLSDVADQKEIMSREKQEKIGGYILKNEEKITEITQTNV